MKTIVVIFEQQPSKMEQFIMILQQIKAAKLKVDVPVFSHVCLGLEEVIYTTHPKRGVEKKPFTKTGYYATYRECIEIKVTDSQYEKIKEIIDYLCENIDKYDKFGAFILGIKMVTGVYLGGIRNKEFTCSALVAYILNLVGKYNGKYWEADMLDIYLQLKSF